MDESSTPVNVQNYGLSGTKVQLAGILILILSATLMNRLVPMSGTPLAVLIIWITFRRSGLGWANLGMSKPKSWGKTILIACVTVIGTAVFLSAAVSPLLSQFSLGRANLSRFASLPGNPLLLLFWLAASWTFAAFGEEIITRGVLLPGVARLIGDGNAAWYFSSIIVSTLFGLAHYYQGSAGMIQTGAISLCFCLAYLWSGRNLWVPILAHGMLDTIGFLTIYSGALAS